MYLLILHSMDSVIFYFFCHIPTVSRSPSGQQIRSDSSDDYWKLTTSGCISVLTNSAVTVFTVRPMRCTVFAIVILSVCHTCVHMVRPMILMSSPYGSPIILVSGNIKFIPKFEGDHPERGHWMRVGWVRIGDFRPISCRISEIVRDTTKVTIDHK